MCHCSGFQSAFHNRSLKCREGVRGLPKWHLSRSTEIQTYQLQPTNSPAQSLRSARSWPPVHALRDRHGQANKQTDRQTAGQAGAPRREAVTKDGIIADSVFPLIALFHRHQCQLTPRAPCHLSRHPRCTRVGEIREQAARARRSHASGGGTSSALWLSEDSAELHCLALHVVPGLHGFMLKCRFTSTETTGLLGMGAQDGHLDFHTAPGLCPTRIQPRTYRVPGSSPSTDSEAIKT